MDAIIICGGNATRFKPMPDKTTLEFLGKPLLMHRYESLKTAGYENINFVANPRNYESISQILNDFRIQARVVIQDNPNNIGGAITSIPDELMMAPTLFVSANDTVEQNIISSIYECTYNNHLDGLVLGKQINEYFPGGYLQINEHGNLISTVEKPEPGTEPSDLINIFYHFYRNPLEIKGQIQANLDQDPQSKTSYEDSLQQVLDGGFTARVLKYSGQWCPIKFPHHAISTGAMITSLHSTPNTPIIHPEAEISAFAQVTGSSFIGKNTIIKADAKVHNSHVLDGTILHSRSMIIDSYVSADSEIQESSFLINVVSDKGLRVQDRSTLLGDHASKKALVYPKNSSV